MRFQFGDFLVDDDSRQLMRAGSVVHLSPKAFDLLVTLIRDRPRALSKADLHARLWPKTFVSDASLAMLVAEVRASLGESARQPQCVRTVHRHGYAFQGTAWEVRDLSPVPAASDSAHLAGGDGAAMGHWLVFPSQQIALAPGDNIIGRDPQARVWLDSPSVSRRHACIRVEGSVVTIEDLGSKNGTRARDAEVHGVTPIADGDVVRFGSFEATLRSWAADPTRTDADSE